VEFKIKPWAHQLEAIEKARGKAYFALFFEMGAGKTATLIHILREKMNEQKKVFKVIIFCPSIVVPNWKNEWILHSNIDPKLIHLLNEDGPKRLKLFQDKAYKGGKAVPGIFVTNYESLNMKALYTEFVKWQADALVFDESHKLKSYTAKRSKAANALANPSTKKPYCYLLSGSPVLNSPMDLFYPFLIMDGGATFGKNFFIFRSRFFIDKNAGIPKHKYFPNWIVAPGSLEKINQLIFKNGMRVKKQECLDLPEEISVTIKCKMVGSQLKNYLEMKKDFITFVGEGGISSANLAIVKALRLMQITSGFLPLNSEGLENDQAKVVYETEKEKTLKELLEELSQENKVIVWAVWKENYGAIKKVCDELKIGYVEVHGSIARHQQDENVERFKTDPSVKVFIGHPGSGGIGINLTCAPYSIFYSRTFSLEQFLQARARNHRGGQKQKVTHYDLVCENSIDEFVQQKLTHKIAIGEVLLRDFTREGWDG
jgi:SNF2 family DNA or RNA helicase